MIPRRPRWRILAAAVLAVSMFTLLVRLGFWQLSRAEFKEDVQHRSQQNRMRKGVDLNSSELTQDAAAWYFRAASGAGHFDPAREFLLDNRTHRGRAGYHVLTPFDLGNRTILVDRGWIPVGRTREVLPERRPVPSGATTLRGTLSTPPRTGLVLGPTGHDGGGAWPRVVQTVDLPAMARELGRPLLPAVVLLDAKDAACHVCDWTAVVGMSPQTHRGYAFQWFALALALFVLCVYVMRRGTRGAY